MSAVPRVDYRLRKHGCQSRGHCRRNNARCTLAIWTDNAQSHLAAHLNAQKLKLPSARYLVGSLAVRDDTFDDSLSKAKFTSYAQTSSVYTLSFISTVFQLMSLFFNFCQHASKLVSSNSNTAYRYKIMHTSTSTNYVINMVAYSVAAKAVTTGVNFTPGIKFLKTWTGL